MKSEAHKKKNDKFCTYWETKRTSKKNYTLKNTAIFSFPFSIIYCLIKEGFTVEFLKFFPFLFAITTILYGLYVYFIEYNLQEKRYQKLKKEHQHFDK